MTTDQRGYGLACFDSVRSHLPVARHSSLEEAMTWIRHFSVSIRSTRWRCRMSVWVCGAAEHHPRWVVLVNKALSGSYGFGCSPFLSGAAEHCSRWVVRPDTNPHEWCFYGWMVLQKPARVSHRALSLGAHLLSWHPLVIQDAGLPVPPQCRASGHLGCDPGSTGPPAGRGPAG